MSQLTIEVDDMASQKRVMIYDALIHENYSCIIVIKQPQDYGKRVVLDPVWAKADILIQQQHIAPDYVDFMIAALNAAQTHADMLEKQYPTGTKVYPE